MTLHVDVAPSTLVWARERAGLDVEDLTKRFPHLREWEHGERTPTLKQLEGFAQATHTPVGFLFLAQPPEERVPIADYRTVSGRGVQRPSPDLLDVIFQCQQRQDWYREYAQLTREDRVGFVGSLSTSTSVADAAEMVSRTLRFDVDQRGATWTDALRTLIVHAEDVGVLVMVSGVVGNNTHRKLNPNEFRGFALVDQLAPLIFINGADTKAAQIFTVTHELVHLFVGETALDDADLTVVPAAEVERWCNEVAAEVLVPNDSLEGESIEGAPAAEVLEKLAQRFKVSTLVVLRRLRDTGWLSWGDYRAAYESELERLLEVLGERASGGNFFNTQPVRVSRRFARAVIGSTLEGLTLRRDAFQMLGIRKQSTFEELAGRLVTERSARRSGRRPSD